MIKLKLQGNENNIKISIGSKPKDISFNVSTYIDGGGFPYYDGSYEVEPDFVKQTLPTKNKSLVENVVVLEIPTHEVTNDYGTTYIVGGI